MNTRILNRLCCPICKGELDLRSFLEESIEYPQREPASNDSERPDQKSTDKVIKDGVLLCSYCKIWYPISSYVPVMLVFKTPFHQQFAGKHSEQFRRLAEYEMPNRSPQPGERSVQETFTDEWAEVHEDELSFHYTEEDLIALNREVSLKWLEPSRGEIRNVLDVGCGLGLESLVLQEVAGDAEVFGVDLNFALLRSGEVYKSKPGLHLVIASLFHLPFQPSSFDLVYSEGVIHHTFSTARAFNSIASYVRSEGYLFIWIYGRDDEMIRDGALGPLTPFTYPAEQVIRPLINRLPKGLRDAVLSSASVALHPLIKARMRHKAKWKLNNTNHKLRDRISPRYAHRHSYNEVLEWFEDLGFEIADVQSPSAFRRLFNEQLWGVGITGKKV